LIETIDCIDCFNIKHRSYSYCSTSDTIAQSMQSALTPSLIETIDCIDCFNIKHRSYSYCSTSDTIAQSMQSASIPSLIEASLRHYADDDNASFAFCLKLYEFLAS
uniref:Uncharacterized protein n=1 Tax=Parascaris univalens TaxID=6257 RepID=A0A915AC50_PARUN